MSELKSVLTKITTGKVTLNYPSLIKLRENKNSKYNTAPRYGATIIIPKEDKDTLGKIEIAIKNAIEIGGFSEKDNIKTPLRDGDIDYPGEGLYADSFYLSAKSILRPSVVDHCLNPITNKYSEFDIGTYAKVSLIFKPYESAEGKGIYSQLGNVQILPGNKLIDLRSKPEDDFVVEEVDEVE